MGLNDNKFKKIIESCHINFMIGSGCSQPYLSTLGGIESLLESLSDARDIEPNKKIIIEASIKKYYFESAIKGNLNISITTDEKLQQTKDAYRKFITALYNIIINRKDNIVGKGVNIFTTNMDIFLETTIESSRCDFNDGFKGRLNPIFSTANFNSSIVRKSSHYDYKSEVPVFNLMKLHGSVNWRQEGENIIFDSQLSSLQKLDETLAKLATKDCFIDVTKIVGNKIVLSSIEELSDKTKDEKKNAKLLSPFIEAYSKIVMINPTKEKFGTTTLNLTFYELLRMYSNYLEKENSVLFVMGFSFSDEHIREITRRVALSNPTLQIIIFGYDKDGASVIDSNIQPSNNNNIEVVYCDTKEGEDEVKLNMAKITELYFSKLVNDIESVGGDTSESTQNE